MLSCQRHLFDLPHDVAYINNAYMAPNLLSMLKVGEEGMRLKNRPWRIEPQHFFEPVKHVQRLFGSLIKAPAAQIAVQPSVSYGIACVMRNVDLEAGDNIVISAEQFPSNVYAWQAACDQAGAELRFAPLGGDPNEALESQIDTNTKVVATAPFHWAYGSAIDLLALRKTCDAHDAIMVLDGTQSVGVVPFDVAEVRPDALICAAYKSLLGPYGTCLSYYSERLCAGEPIEYNWINRKDSDQFQELVNYQPAFAEGAQRFSMGQQSNFILIPMLAHALEKILNWQAQSILDYCTQQMEPVIAFAEAKGLAMAQRRSPHLLGIELPDGMDIKAVGQALYDDQVVVSLRGNAIRLSPHVYTSDADIERLLTALGRLL